MDHGGDGDADEEEVERSHHVRHIWIRHVVTLSFRGIDVISGQDLLSHLHEKTCCHTGQDIYHKIGIRH